LSMHVCFVLFPLFDLSFVDFPSVLWYCWLGLLTGKNRLPYNLYCVGGDVRHSTIQSKATLHSVCSTCWWVAVGRSPLVECFCHSLLVFLADRTNGRAANATVLRLSSVVVGCDVLYCRCG